MGWIKKISEAIGFTDQEIKVVIFIAALFLVGMLAYYIKYKASYEEYKIFDYSKTDSLFLECDSSVAGSKKSENLVDSEQELLDFRIDDLSDRNRYNRLLSEKSIDLNSADVNTLCLLPGIGIKTAEKIVSLRTAKGSFKSLDELLEVKGIGKIKFDKIKVYLYIK